MTIDQFINVLVTVMLIEMMVAVGLGVGIAELTRVARNRRLLLQAGIANYVCVPAATVALLILAGSSAIAAPSLLRFLLPWLSGDETLQVNAVKIVATLLLTQLVPLCVGLGLRHWRPVLAERLQKPANLMSAILGLSTVGLILVVQFDLLAEIGLRGWAGMSALLFASAASGWLLGGPGIDNRKAVALTTCLRNVGVGLMIAVGNFAGTAAVTAALAYGIFEIVGSLLLAVGWGPGQTH